MSDDLISRRDVMNLLSKKNKDGVPDNECDRAVYFFVESLIDNIRDDIPTAYDVDKVIERLEREGNNIFESHFPEESFEFYNNGIANGFWKAAKIAGDMRGSYGKEMPNFYRITGKNK